MKLKATKHYQIHPMEKKSELFGQPNILIIFFYFCASIFKTISIYISFFMIFKRLIGFYFIPFCCQADWKLYGLFIFIYQLHLYLTFRRPKYLSPPHGKCNLRMLYLQRFLLPTYVQLLHTFILLFSFHFKNQMVFYMFCEFDV